MFRHKFPVPLIDRWSSLVLLVLPKAASQYFGHFQISFSLVGCVDEYAWNFWQYCPLVFAKFPIIFESKFSLLETLSFAHLFFLTNYTLENNVYTRLVKKCMSVFHAPHYSDFILTLYTAVVFIYLYRLKLELFFALFSHVVYVVLLRCGDGNSLIEILVHHALSHTSPVSLMMQCYRVCPFKLWGSKLGVDTLSFKLGASHLKQSLTTVRDVKVKTFMFTPCLPACPFFLIVENH